MTAYPRTPSWFKGVLLPTFPKLAESLQTEAVIIGGGLTGMLAAYLLAKNGNRVILLEKETIGSGATGRTTGFLTQSIDTAFGRLVWMLGKEKTKLVIESHGAAIELLQKIVKNEQIECEFMRCENIIFTPETAKDSNALNEELESARMLGLDAYIEKANWLPFPNKGSLHIKNQGKYHPLKFLAGLAIAAKKAGALIYEHTEATKLETNADGVTVFAGNKIIKAQFALSAAYEPFTKSAGLYFKKAMYASYVMELAVPKGTIPEGTYEDTENPYHYFRIDSTGAKDRIILGGQGHRLDIPVSSEKNFTALMEYAKKIFPLASGDIATRWQGHVLEPIDGLAFIGPYKSRHTWYAFGFSGNGMTYAGITAMMFLNAVSGKENPWSTVYRVERIPGVKSLLIKGVDYIGEFLNGAVRTMFTSAGKTKS